MWPKMHPTEHCAPQVLNCGPWVAVYAPSAVIACVNRSYHFALSRRERTESAVYIQNTWIVFGTGKPALAGCWLPAHSALVQCVQCGQGCGCFWNIWWELNALPYLVLCWIGSSKGGTFCLPNTYVVREVLATVPSAFKLGKFTLHAQAFQCSVTLHCMCWSSRWLGGRSVKGVVAESVSNAVIAVALKPTSDPMFEVGYKLYSWRMEFLWLFTELRMLVRGELHSVDKCGMHPSCLL